MSADKSSLNSGTEDIVRFAGGTDTVFLGSEKIQGIVTFGLEVVEALIKRTSPPRTLYTAFQRVVIALVATSVLVLDCDQISVSAVRKSLFIPEAYLMIKTLIHGAFKFSVGWLLLAETLVSLKAFR
jgi:hypothetical protein